MISEEIVSYADFLSFSGCMLYFHNSTRQAFGKRIRSMTIYSCEDQMRHVLEALQDPEVAKFVRKLTLLAEGLREHEYGYVWGWEDLQVWMNLDYNPNDIRVINRINADHANARDDQASFIYSGQYRNCSLASSRSRESPRRSTQALSAGPKCPSNKLPPTM